MRGQQPRPSWRRGSSTAVVTGVILGGLVGCSPSGVIIPAGGDDLPLCAARTLTVDQLDGAGAPGCNLQGTVVEFRDGVTMTVSAIGANTAKEPNDPPGRIYSLINWGVPGVGSYLEVDGSLGGLWGSSAQARDLQLQQARVDGVDVSGYTPR